MKRLAAAILGVSSVLHCVAGASLVFLMLLTIADVAGRTFGKPIAGALEMVGFAGGIAIGCALPYTSWMRGHVYVDTVLGWLPKRGRAAFNVATRFLGIGLFAVLGWNLVKLANSLRLSGEVSPTREIPFYPIVLGIAIAAFVQVAVLCFDLVKIRRGEYE